MMPPGQTDTFTAMNGKISVELGSVQATVTMRVHQKIIPGWRYRPTTAPFTLSFSSVA
jgi:hypothetical protein